MELVEAVPGMKLVFDTANHAFNRDRSKPGESWQNPLEFYQNVKEHIAYVHIKDCLSPSPENNKGDGLSPIPGCGEGTLGCCKRNLGKIEGWSDTQED